MQASSAIAVPQAQTHLFDVVETAPDESGQQRAATYSDGMNATVTLQASPALLRRGFPAAIELLCSQQASDFAVRVAQEKLGLSNPRPSLSDAPYAVDKDGKMLLHAGNIAAYRIDIKLVAGNN